jgi:hypothetical protein
VLANMVTRPPTNACKESNQLASKTSHPRLNDVWWSCLSIVAFRIRFEL